MDAAADRVMGLDGLTDTAAEGLDGGAGGGLDGAAARREWAASGAMWLTGHPGGPPRWAPAALPVRLRLLVGALAEATAHWARPGRWGRRVEPDPATILAGRAALAGLTRGGRISTGGSCRLLRGPDGWLAVNLARRDDVVAVAAALELDRAPADPWTALADQAVRRPVAALRDRCQLVGIPAAVADFPATTRRTDSGMPLAVRRSGSRRAAPPTDPPLVVDLSAMWAGPLCAKLLGDAGANVVKVESRTRPDGARRGDARFFDWLHAGQQSVAVDFDDRAGRAALAALVTSADVVVESARPRALAALGIDAEAEVARRAGLVWIRLTAYGPRGIDTDADGTGVPVGFGDDIAAGGGLLAPDGDGEPVFCGDAIADPLSGLAAAVAVLDSWRRGGGELLELSMVDVVRGLVAGPRNDPIATVTHTGPAGDDDWEVHMDGDRFPVARPAEPVATGRAAPFGADTASVLNGLDR